MRKYRIVPDDVCAQAGNLASAVRELGNEALAQTLENISLAKEFAQPSWPQSLLLLDRLRDKLTAMRGDLDDIQMELHDLSDKVCKEMP